VEGAVMKTEYSGLMLALSSIWLESIRALDAEENRNQDGSQIINIGKTE